MSVEDQQIQAKFYSALNSFDYNAGQGFAMMWYDRDSMRELLNFHFQDGLDLNNDDDWDKLPLQPKTLDIN